MTRILTYLFLQDSDRRYNRLCLKEEDDHHQPEETGGLGRWATADDVTGRCPVLHYGNQRLDPGVKRTVQIHQLGHQRTGSGKTMYLIIYLITQSTHFNNCVGKRNNKSVIYDYVKMVSICSYQ